MKYPSLTRRFSLLSVGALALTSLISGQAWAAPITKTVTVQVYQLCDDAGNNCASTGPAGNAFFSNETNKIWSQAGSQVIFNFVAQPWRRFRGVLLSCVLLESIEGLLRMGSNIA